MYNNKQIKMSLEEENNLNEEKNRTTINVDKYLKYNPEKYKDKGITGLQNLVNTCFMNSLLQCLSHTYELNEFLDNGNINEKFNRKPETVILHEWDELRKLMWSSNCIIKPGRFLTKMKKIARIKDRILFTGFLQNDLCEFLIFIMDCFHNAIERQVEMNVVGEPVTSLDKLAVKSYEMMQNIYKNEYSEFLELFYGISISEINSLESSYQSITPEPFFLLNLAIPKNSGEKNIYDCFDLHVKSEKLGDDNQFFNEESGKKENVEKKLSFWKLPNVLIFTLKRFSNECQKNNEFIDFPLNGLDLSKYVKGYDAEKYVYDLYAVCYHLGQFNGGHYLAHIKNANGKWYEFNDEDVEETTSGSGKSFRGRQAYCFFYRKRQ
tara:strand:- start:1027 stop:2163 length:1137 start_codon:yes stop_codon:yes gene_type:complete